MCYLAQKRVKANELHLLVGIIDQGIIAQDATLHEGRVFALVDVFSVYECHVVSCCLRAHMGAHDQRLYITSGTSTPSTAGTRREAPPRHHSCLRQHTACLKAVHILGPSPLLPVCCSLSATTTFQSPLGPSGHPLSRVSRVPRLPRLRAQPGRCQPLRRSAGTYYPRIPRRRRERLHQPQASFIGALRATEVECVCAGFCGKRSNLLLLQPAVSVMTPRTSHNVVSSSCCP